MLPKTWGQGRGCTRGASGEKGVGPQAGEKGDGLRAGEKDALLVDLDGGAEGVGG